MPKVAVACFQRKVSGYVTFKQRSARSRVYVTLMLKLRGADAAHGFHIHTSGDLRASDCSKCGGQKKGATGGIRTHEAVPIDLKSTPLDLTRAR